MIRVEPEELSDRDTSLIFIAGSLSEARRAENWLADAGIAYIVQVEPFVENFLFGTRTRNGAVFYVAAGQADYCRKQLTDAGLERGVVREDEKR